MNQREQLDWSEAFLDGGFLSAGAKAAMVRFLAEGASVRSAVDQSLAMLCSHARHEQTEEAIRKAIALAGQPCTDQAAAVETLGGGWVGAEALSIGLYAALSAKSFVEAIGIATNHSGDSDSTASIAGQLWGAVNGLDGIPHIWVCSGRALASASRDPEIPVSP